MITPKNITFRSLTFLSLIFFTTSALGAENLLKNGDFESPDESWTHISTKEGATIKEEGGNHFLNITTQSNDQVHSRSSEQTINVGAGQWLQLTGKIRVNAVEPDGGATWHNARVQLTWKDEANKEVSPWPPSPEHNSPTDGWKEFKTFLKVPQGAAKLQVAPAIFLARGNADFDDLVLTAVPETDVPAADIRKQAQKQPAAGQ